MDVLTQRILTTFGVSLPADGKMPIDVPGLTRTRLAQFFAEVPFLVGAEIGVERGEFTEVLMRSHPNLTLYAIDAWAHYRGYRDHVDQKKLDGFHAFTVDRLKPWPTCQIVKGFSMDVVRDFPPGSLDFVYLDGNHGFDWITEDLITWSRRVRSGGIVSGHDFVRRRNGVNDVVPSVNQYAYRHEIPVWFTTGEVDTKVGESRSWFWVKP